MKERIRFTLVATVAAALLLAGCSAQAKSNTATAIQGDSSYYGQVVKAVGNEITLALGTKVETQTITEGEGESPSENTSPGENTSGDISPGEPPDGQMPGGDAPADGAGPGTDTQRARTTLTLTGEEVTITIPVGVPVMRTLGGQSVSTTFTQITQENILEIVLKDVDSGQRVVGVNILS